MPDVTAMRYGVEDRGDGEITVEADALVAVEVADMDAARSIDLILSPRTPNALTVSFTADEAWALARELARAASEIEVGGPA